MRALDHRVPLLPAVCGPAGSERATHGMYAKAGCQALLGQELALFRHVTHYRAPLCYSLPIQFILEN